MLGSDEDFSKYMNKPECNVNIGDICKRTDYFICETEYRVDDIVEKMESSMQYVVSRMSLLMRYVLRKFLSTIWKGLGDLYGKW